MGDTPDAQPPFFFHRFAQDNPRQGLQLANSQGLDSRVQHLWDPESEYIYFCSDHFEENRLY